MPPASGSSKPTAPRSAGGAAPAAGTTTACSSKVAGAPAPIPPTSNSIVCMHEKLVVQNNNSGPDRGCTNAHEEQHIRDWKARYGDELCSGVPDGQLPLGGDGYAAFLESSECKAYKVGIACREELLKKADEKDKPAIRRAIERDKLQMKKYCKG